MFFKLRKMRWRLDPRRAYIALTHLAVNTIASNPWASSPPRLSTSECIL